jgi:hypothetical protein
VGQPGKFIRYDEIPYGGIISADGYIPTKVQGGAIGDLFNLEEQ